MKAASSRSFGVDKKYAKISLSRNHRDPMTAWSGVSRCHTFALSYAEAVVVAEAMKWTETESWNRGGYCTTNLAEAA